MASEAARQKYPPAIYADDGYDSNEDAREAYDAGRVDALREAADDRWLRLSGHSGISISRLRELADRIESQANDKEARG